MSRTSKAPGSTTRDARRTAGLILATIHTGASSFLLEAVVGEAEKTGTNLFCFPGGQLNVGGYERGRNSVYRLVSGEVLDGIVSWASSLGGSVDRAANEAFHANWKDLPLVTLGMAMEGIPSVTIDAGRGMRELINHLIRGHGYRTIAFLRGPHAHVPANDRFEAYLDTLSENGVRRRDELIADPVPWTAGEVGVRQLLDERGLVPGRDFQAIAAASDLQVFAGVRELQRRGYRIPGDVAAAGFNNITESLLLSPALTTVEMPFTEMGRTGLGLLLERMDDPSGAERVQLPTRLVIRESCGCPSQRILLAENGEPDPGPIRGGARGVASDVEAALEAAFSGEPGFPALSSAEVGELVSAFLSDACGKTAGTFTPRLHDVLENAVHSDRPVAPWQDAVSILRRYALRPVSGCDAARTEDLCSRSRVMISDAVDRSRRFQAWSGAQRDRELSELGRKLLIAYDFQSLGDVLAENLPKLGIPSAYVAVYSDSFDMPEYARLVVGFTEAGWIVDRENPPVFPVKELVPAQYLPRDRRFTSVVLPLFHQDYQLGYAVLEMTSCDGAMYEELRTYISSALRGAFLFREVEQARQAAEAADRLKSRFLANVSHELRTPLMEILHHVSSSLRKDRGEGIPKRVRESLYAVQRNAEHQLQVTSDLLDLSRAEIEHLKLSPSVLDPRAILLSEFLAAESASGDGSDVRWTAELPPRLPVIQADPDRFAQIIRNLLDNAVRYTRSGSITLVASVEPPYLSIRISDTGAGMSRQQQEMLFEPFTSADEGERRHRGTGLGLSLARRLVSLHAGSLDVESAPGMGTTVSAKLPLPCLSGTPIIGTGESIPLILLISDGVESAREIREIAELRGYLVRHVGTETDLEQALQTSGPAALAWDIGRRSTGDWALVRNLRHHPLLYEAPFLLYGWTPVSGGEETGGTLSLMDAVNSACPAPSAGPAVILSGQAAFREYYSAVVEGGLSGFTLSCFVKTEDALSFMMDELPSIFILDLDTFSATGIETILRLRCTERFHGVPILVVSGEVISNGNVSALEDCTRVVLVNHGILTVEESGALVRSMVFVGKIPAPFTGTLVRRVVGYLNQNFPRSITRWKLAQSVNVSEDYLTRVFRKEIGISPWVYLNRYRISRACAMLRQGDQSIQNISVQCGFRDQAYFCRVFRSITGMSPLEYRKKSVHA